MRVAIIVWAFPPKWLGGTELASLKIADGLSNMGIDVHIITPNDGVEELPNLPFTIHRIPVSRKLGLFMGSFLFGVVKTIRNIRPDVIHAQGVSVGLYALLPGLLFRVPYVVYARSELRSMKMPGPLISVVARLVLGNAGAVIAQTETQLSELWCYSNGRKEVIPNGVDCERFRRCNGDAIIYLGNLRPEKGLPFLIEAIAKIQVEKRPLLRIVGGGTEFHSLSRLVEEKNLSPWITLTGPVPNESVPEAFDGCGIFVLPSTSEGFPLALLEAMASSLAVVCTKVCRLPEIITEGENGLLIPPGEPTQLANALLTLIGNVKMREKMGSINRKKVECSYSWLSVCSKLNECYKAVRFHK